MDVLWPIEANRTSSRRPTKTVDAQVDWKSSTGNVEVSMPKMSFHKSPHVLNQPWNLKMMCERGIVISFHVCAAVPGGTIAIQSTILRDYFIYKWAAGRFIIVIESTGKRCENGTVPPRWPRYNFHFRFHLFPIRIDTDEKTHKCNFVCVHRACVCERASERANHNVCICMLANHQNEHFYFWFIF